MRPTLDKARNSRMKILSRNMEDYKKKNSKKDEKQLFLVSRPEEGQRKTGVYFFHYMSLTLKYYTCINLTKMKNKIL